MENEQLLKLWKDVFGEYDGFWELFLRTGFSPERCRCILENGQAAASLCWFDTQCLGQKLAYLYAVVTHPEYRNRGLCRRLMADTHRQLRELGYAGALLVPAESSLRAMYEKMGYRNCTTVTEFTCEAGADPVPLRAVGPAEYARLRREFLPWGGVVQEGENLRFLAEQAQFYTGEDLLLAVYREEDVLHGMELLGNAEAAPGILRTLGCAKGHFRTPGEEIPFAMFLPLRKDAVRPAYFGFAFD